MTQVFISYTRRNEYDKQFAENMRTWLIDNGFAVWMDVHDIPSGAHWDSEIDKGLQASDIVLGLLSPDSVTSDNVKNEWAWALQRNKLQLALLAPCDIPHRFVRIDYIDFSKQDKNAWRRLYDTLQAPPNLERPGVTPKQKSNPIQDMLYNMLAVFGVGKRKPRFPSQNSKRNLVVGMVAGGLGMCACLYIAAGALSAVLEGAMFNPGFVPGVNNTIDTDLAGNAAELTENFLSVAVNDDNYNAAVQNLCPGSQSNIISELNLMNTTLQQSGVADVWVDSLSCTSSGSNVTCNYNLNYQDVFGQVIWEPINWSVPVQNGQPCPRTLFGF